VIVANAAALNVRATMSSVDITDNQFDPNGYWDKPVEKIVYLPTAEDVALFDQNGYDLTDLEKHYAYSNWTKPKKHREHRVALKQPWFVEKLPKITGPVLNHSLLFERKGYTGAALEELKQWAKTLPLIHKVIALRPKWGLDFSMDWVDREGNAFEVLHWEWDSFDYNEIQAVKLEIEPVLAAIDWQDAGQNILAKKEQWYSLDFFAQSRWKCQYFGIPEERFKMVAWS
jgi:hypothetical protein